MFLFVSCILENVNGENVQQILPPGKEITMNSFSEKLIGNVNKVIVGKDKQIELLLVSLLVGGHVLLEDVPGTGKTKTARALAQSLDLDFKRVQFTIDLLPSDLTGINFFDREANKFVFRQGPIFTNILLAEIQATIYASYGLQLVARCAKREYGSKACSGVAFCLLGEREQVARLLFVPFVLLFGDSPKYARKRGDESYSVCAQCRCSYTSVYIV